MRAANQPRSNGASGRLGTPLQPRRAAGAQLLARPGEADSRADARGALPRVAGLRGDRGPGPRADPGPFKVIA